MRCSQSVGLDRWDFRFHSVIPKKLSGFSSVWISEVIKQEMRGSEDVRCGGDKVMGGWWGVEIWKERRERKSWWFSKYRRAFNCFLSEMALGSDRSALSYDSYFKSLLKRSMEMWMMPNWSQIEELVQHKIEQVELVPVLLTHLAQTQHDLDGREPSLICCSLFVIITEIMWKLRKRIRVQ